VKIISGNSACGIMQTHLLTMLHLSVHVMQSAMSGHISSLILLNEQYTPPMSATSEENKYIHYAYSMV